MDEPKTQNTSEAAPKTGDDELDAMIAKKTALARKRAERAKELEKEKLRLELKYEDELGPRGEQFEIVDATDLGEGFVVVKLGVAATANHFMSTKVTETDLDAFVVPHVVHPAKEEYRMIAARRPGLAHACANVLLTLYGLKKTEDAKKA